MVRAVAALASLVVALAACDANEAPGPPDASPADVPAIVTLEVAGGETYRIRLTDPDDARIARRLLAGEDAPSIPNGVVVRGQPDVNDGYSWSIDPEGFEWADMTMEGCDGIPSDVEAGVVTSERYCPWSAIVVGIEPAP